MLFKNLFLLFLPALTYSHIGINIKPDKDISEATVDFFGEDVAIITDQERNSFHLDDESLKAASKIFAGERCTDVFLKRPTPWEDVYRKFGWREIQRTLKPVGARVIGVNGKPVSVATAEYENQHLNLKAKYSTAVTQTVEEKVSHSWSKDGELTIARDINYNIGFKSSSLGGKTSLSYKSKWGNDTTQERKITLGTISNVEVELSPGEGLLATLIATKGTMEIDVDYEATVTGHVFCNYHNGYRNHHWWAYPVNFLQEYGNLPTKVKSTERITIGFYTNAKIVVSDLKTNHMIRKVPAGIILTSDWDVRT